MRGDAGRYGELWPTCERESRMYMRTPTDHMSHAVSYPRRELRDSSTSGAKYWGVPQNVAALFSAPLVSLARPKSAILTIGRVLATAPGGGRWIRMFSGLRSRWTMWRACRCLSAASSWCTVG